MKKFERVEKAYHTIKSATGLNAPDKIISKFLNREKTYNKLLVKIA